MGRVLAIDYGKKRTGLAVTDPLRIIATRLDTVESAKILDFLADYFKRETVDLVIVGYPRQMNFEPSEAIRYINPFLKALVRKFPDIAIETVDERFTSKLAQLAIIDGGVKKSGRQNKALVDGVSATIILQSWLEQNRTEK